MYSLNPMHYMKLFSNSDSIFWLFWLDGRVAFLYLICKNIKKKLYKAKFKYENVAINQALRRSTQLIHFGRQCLNGTVSL